jgi:isoleucyl-tRNA synthetase
MLHLAAVLDQKLRNAVDDFDFNSYVRALTDFCNEDLSAFFFDIRKDVLYCEVNALDGAQTERRRAYRTVLDTLFHALVRWLSPVLVFTSEEVWGTRYPDAGSVHLLEWPELPFIRHLRESGGPASLDGPEEQRDSRFRGSDEFLLKWDDIRAVREMVTEAIEPLRRDKIVGSSLEAEVQLGSMVRNEQVRSKLTDVDMAEICIVSRFEWANSDEVEGVLVRRTENHKCGRCWRHLPEVKADGDLCDRCEEVVNG